MGPIWLPYGTHMGVEPFPCTFSRTVLEHKNIYECFQIMKSFLLDSDAYKTNNASHKNKKIIYQIAIIPICSISTSPIWDPYVTHMGPIWEQPKIGKVDILEAIYKKILDEIFLQMRFRSTYTYLTKI